MGLARDDLMDLVVERVDLREEVDFPDLTEMLSSSRPMAVPPSQLGQVLITWVCSGSEILIYDIE